MNSSPSPHPKRTADSSPLLSGGDKPTFSQSDMPTGAPPDQSASTASVAVEVGSTLSGYKLIQKLGEGGMGAVFIAEDIALRRKVALKTMKPELAAKETSKQRFFREARAAARIEHDNIVPIFQVGEVRGIPFLAMALLKGESLGDYLKKNARPDVPFILTIGRDVADGLAAAHHEGLIHRDIKPDNIWIEPQPKTGGVRGKILDFGLARPQDEEQSLVTQEGAILGTPAYMAPEQARGMSVDHRADLFSLGVMLYQMAVGQRPFTGRDTMAILSSLALDTPTEPLKLNPEIPPILSRLIMMLLEKDMTKRVQKASDVSDVLKRLQPRDTVVVVATPQAVEANPWADIDASSMTDADPPPPPLAASRPQPVKVVPRDRTEVVSRDAASGSTRSRKPLFIGGAVLGLIALIAVIIVIIRDKDGNKVAELKVPDGGSVEIKDKTDNSQKKVESKNTDPKTVAIAPAVDYALQFDGDGEVTIDKFEFNASKPFTIEGYARLDRLTTGKTDSFRLVQVHTGGNITLRVTQLGLWSVAGTAGQVYGSGPVDVGKRTHVAFVYAGETFNLYLNGKRTRVKGKPEWKEFERALSKNAIPLLIGGIGTLGLIDEVRISKVARYDKDFTPAARHESDKETLALYHFDEGQGDVLKDSSGNGHDGKIVGAKWVKADGSPVPKAPAAGYALVFEGEGVVTLPTLKFDPSMPYTLEAYAKPTKKLASGKSSQIVGGVQFRDIDRWRFVRPTSGSSEGPPPVAAELQRRVHLAGVFTGEKLSLYIDGKLANTMAIANKAGPTRSNLEVGKGFFGEIDEVRVSTSARYFNDFVPAARFEPDKDTLALYHFDEGEGDVANDSSGNNHHCKIVGARWVKADGAPPPAPASAHGLRFSKRGDIVDLPAIKIDPVKTYTLEVWATPGTASVSDGAYAHFVMVDRLHLQMYRDNRFGFSAATEVNLSKDRRVHLALVQSPQELRAYVDGKLVGGGELKRPPSNRNGAANIGGHSGPSGFFDGIIDEVRLSEGSRYNAEFAPLPRFEADKDTIALYHFDEGQGDELKDSSGNNHHGKIVGAKWVKSDGSAIPPAAAADHALEFKGGDDLVTLPGLTVAPQSRFTWEAWVDPKEHRNMSLATLPSTDGLGLYRVALKNNGPQANIVVASKNAIGMTASNSLPENGPFHLAVSFDGNRWSLWVNGKKVNEGASHFGWTYEVKKTFTGRLGADSGFPIHPEYKYEPFQGRLDEIRVSKTTRYDKDFTPAKRFEPDKDTLALYHCDEGQGDELKDSSGNNYHGKIVGAKWVKGDATVAK